MCVRDRVSPDLVACGLIFRASSACLECESLAQDVQVARLPDVLLCVGLGEGPESGEGDAPHDTMAPCAVVRHSNCRRSTGPEDVSEIPGESRRAT